jgi:hypothetical protein
VAVGCAAKGRHFLLISQTQIVDGLISILPSFFPYASVQSRSFRHSVRECQQVSADNCVLCKVIVRDDGRNASSGRHCAHKISSCYILAYIRSSDAGVMLFHPPISYLLTCSLTTGVCYECDGLPCPSGSIVFYESKSYGWHLRSNLSRLDLVHSQYSRPEVTPSFAFHARRLSSFFSGLLLYMTTQRTHSTLLSALATLREYFSAIPLSFSNKRFNKR